MVVITPASTILRHIIIIIEYGYLVVTTASTILRHIIIKIE